MLEFGKFLEGQQRIYDNNFRGKRNLVRREGVLNGVPNITGGYLLAFRYGGNVGDELSDLSKEIVDAVPEGCAMFYPSRIVHTTLSDYGILPIEQFRKSEDVLERLTNSVSRCLNGIRAPSIEFRDVLYNQTAVIVEGTPDQAFVDLTNRVIESCKEEGIGLREPWGSHVTISRFVKETPQKELERLFETTDRLKAPEDGIIKYFDIGTFVFGSHGLIQENYQRFELPT